MSDLVRQLAAAASRHAELSAAARNYEKKRRGPWIDDPPVPPQMPQMPVEAPPMDLPSDELAGADISTFGLEVAPKSPFEPDDLPPVIRKKKQRQGPEGPYVGQRRGRG